MPEPMGKLDTSVNGPEGLPFDADAWEQVDWRHHEEQVRRLRGRIFKAVREGDWPLARNVQKLMLRSWGNTLVSVRQVTQRNAGRKTAGIDGLVALTSQARAEMAVRVHASIGSHRPSPARRVYVPKASDKTKMRPLGIPVIADRCHQARVKNALEPEWEARFEPRSYGFRPGRACHDAIESLYNTRLSSLCSEVFPGQAEDADFFGGRLVRARCLKSGGDDDAAELGAHVGGGRLGFAGVPGGAGPVFGHVGGVVAGGGVPAGGDGLAGELERDGPLDRAGGAVAGLPGAEDLPGVFDRDLDGPSAGVSLDHLGGGGGGIGGDQGQVIPGR